MHSFLLDCFSTHTLRFADVTLFIQIFVGSSNILSARLWWTSTISSSSIIIIERGTVYNSSLSFSLSVRSVSLILSWRLLNFLYFPFTSIWIHFIIVTSLPRHQINSFCKWHHRMSHAPRFILSLRFLSFFLRGRWDAACGRSPLTTTFSQSNVFAARILIGTMEPNKYVYVLFIILLYWLLWVVEVAGCVRAFIISHTLIKYCTHTPGMWHRREYAL